MVVVVGRRRGHGGEEGSVSSQLIEPLHPFLYFPTLRKHFERENSSNDLNKFTCQHTTLSSERNYNVFRANN